MMIIKLKTKLLPHQQQGFEKLKALKVGALYMEMGTGKTRTMLEIIKDKADRDKIDHVLWLCPCSCKINLQRDIKKHAEIKNLTICGIETLSSSIRVITEMKNLVETQRCLLVVDESNLVKNPKALRSKRVVNFSRNCKYKYILNGTPITKNIADLFNQWYILDWRILGYKSYYSFAANHLELDDDGKIREVLNVDYLVDKIGLYTYQAKKDDVLNLPSKRISKVYFDLTAEQYEHYQEVTYEFLSLLDTAEVYQVSVMIYRTLTALQQVTSGQRITSEARKQIQHEDWFANPHDNPRMQCLIDTLRAFSDEKVIIWCKFSHEINDIKNVLTALGYKCVCFYGEMNLKQRQRSIDEFADSAQIFIANKACAGYGLNLQFCYNAIYYNNDYDYGTRIQSEDRIHRIGQENTVNIIDIVADRTIDERIADSLERKYNLCEDFKGEVAKNNKNIAEWFGIRRENSCEEGIHQE